MATIDDAKFITKYIKNVRSAELFELNDRTGYIIRFIDGKIVKDERLIVGKSMYYIIDTCETWCEGIVDPWI